MTIATTRSGTATATGDEPVRVRRLRAAVLAAAALTVAAGITLAGASPAFAHDELLGSSPEAGEVFDTAPTEIVLDFSNDIIEVGTAIEVVDHHGEEVAIGEPVIAGPQVTAALPADLEGDYQVRWRAVSSDGHPIEGTIDFGVGADATGVWEEQAAHSEAAEEPEEADADDTSDTVADAGNGWVIAGAVVLLLALIAMIVGIIVRAKRKAPGAE